LCTSMPIYLMFIRVLLWVEFCLTLKIYLKGAPFYNASAWGNRGAVECRPSQSFAKPVCGKLPNADDPLETALGQLTTACTLGSPSFLHIIQTHGRATRGKSV
jgi:hypothetical protein